MTAALDNPLWASLSSFHRALALGSNGQLRYPADVAPFLAVAHADVPFEPSLVAPGETVFVLGPRPAGVAVEDFGEIFQMVCADPPPVIDGPVIVPLDNQDHRRAILELAALVYPHYFRARTPELGRYFGIYLDGTLAAMIGERMGMPGFREISAVCTHPDHLGRGLARRLLTYLARDIAVGASTPFLHVSPTNHRAVQLYLQNGFTIRRGVPFAALRP